MGSHPLLEGHSCVPFFPFPRYSSPVFPGDSEAVDSGWRGLSLLTLFPTQPNTLIFLSTRQARLQLRALSCSSCLTLVYLETHLAPQAKGSSPIDSSLQVGCHLYLRLTRLSRLPLSPCLEEKSGKHSARDLISLLMKDTAKDTDTQPREKMHR